VQAIAAQPQRAPDGAPVHYERHRSEQTTLYRLVQQYAATFIAEAEAIAGAEPGPRRGTALARTGTHADLFDE
jgi:hypothetical protein